MNKFQKFRQLLDSQLETVMHCITSHQNFPDSSTEYMAAALEIASQMLIIQTRNRNYREAHPLLDLLNLKVWEFPYDSISPRLKLWYEQYVTEEMISQLPDDHRWAEMPDKITGVDRGRPHTR